ncbi:MAG: DUF3696 domain-containing protein [Phototrophicales bacterium]|nr:DUF3696 domain-containing protein [Phototrophicales bacterium]
MLTHIRMQNFKSWQDTEDIRMAPLTGFFGANSSGKTSLLQMLLLLKETTESSDRNASLSTDIKEYIEIGALSDLIHRGTKELKLTIGWQLSQEILVSEDIALKNLTFSTNIVAPTQIRRFEYQSDRFKAWMEINEKNQYYSVKVMIDGIEAKKQNNRPFKYITRPIKCYGFSAEALRFYQDTEYLSDLSYAFEQYFKQVYHLGPVRDYPKRQYTWSGDKPSDVGRKGERAISALLASSGERLKKGKGTPKRHDTLIGRVEYWLQKMGLSTSLTIEPVVKGSALYEVKLRRMGDGQTVLLPDMGFGMSQILPVIVLCYYCPEGSTLLLEQPEIHLHPSAQAVLADMFIEVIQERKVQIILESHSEHLLTRLQLRMAEGKLDSQAETALYFCDFKKGKSHLSSLDVDMFGEIRNYPDEFFGDLAGDVIKRTIEAAERRMQVAG